MHRSSGSAKAVCRVLTRTPCLRYLCESAPLTTRVKGSFFVALQLLAVSSERPLASPDSTAGCCSREVVERLILLCRECSLACSACRAEPSSVQYRHRLFWRP